MSNDTSVPVARWRHYDEQTVFAFNMAVIAPIALAPWITGSDLLAIWIAALCLATRKPWRHA